MIVFSSSPSHTIKENIAFVENYVSAADFFCHNDILGDNDIVKFPPMSTNNYYKRWKHDPVNIYVIPLSGLNFFSNLVVILLQLR